jgi:DNA-binding NarL/FixJ family response regulator
MVAAGVDEADKMENPRSGMAARPSADGLRVLLAVPERLCCTQLDTYLAATRAVAVVGRTSSESTAMQLFFREQPDVTVLDWRIAESEPARLVGLLKRVAPGACVIAVVPGVDSMPARAARALDADLIVTCGELPATLTDCIATRVARAPA